MQFKLWEAYYNEASAALSGGRGQRFESLRAVKAASELPVPPGHSLAELRNVAIAALCLPDVGPGPEWEIGTSAPDDATLRRAMTLVNRRATLPKPNFSPRGDLTSPGFRLGLAALEPYVTHKQMTVPMRLYRMDTAEPVRVLDDTGVHEEAKRFQQGRKRARPGAPGRNSQSIRHGNRQGNPEAES